MRAFFKRWIYERKINGMDKIESALGCSIRSRVCLVGSDWIFVDWSDILGGGLFLHL